VKCKLCDSEKFISNNDNAKIIAIGLNIKWKEGERELDSGKTERERERERERESMRGSALRHKGVASVQRSTVLHKHVTEICKLISEINDVDNGLVSTTQQLHVCYSHNDI
jgi:hypothetical protein